MILSFLLNVWIFGSILCAILLLSNLKTIKELVKIQNPNSKFPDSDTAYIIGIIFSSLFWPLSIFFTKYGDS